MNAKEIQQESIQWRRVFWLQLDPNFIYFESTQSGQNRANSLGDQLGGKVRPSELFNAIL